MTFNIHQKVGNRYGETSEEKATEYRNQLFKLFVESPEGQALFDEGISPGWADAMMDYAFGYIYLLRPPQYPLYPAHGEGVPGKEAISPGKTLRDKIARGIVRRDS